MYLPPCSCLGLTRIRPNNHAFKDAFFRSNPHELILARSRSEVMAEILPVAGRLNNPKLRCRFFFMSGSCYWGGQALFFSHLLSAPPIRQVPSYLTVTY